MRNLVSLTTITENKKQQNTDNVLLLVKIWDIMLKIFNNLNPFEPIRDPDNCDVRLILS